jgi:hypothetical protein
MSGSSALVLSNRSYPTPEVSSVFAKDLYDWQTVSTLTTMPSGGSISRSGNAMLYDSTGKLTYAPNNLFPSSNLFSLAEWAVAGGISTVTPNAATGPDGTLSMSKLVETNTTTNQRIGKLMPFVLNTPIIFSVYAKAAERSVLQMLPGSSFLNPAYANFDLSVGTVTASSNCTAQISSVGSGIYRCSIKIVPTVGNGGNDAIYLFMQTSTTAARAATYAGDGTSGLYVYGSQFEYVTYQTTPSTYVATTSAAYYGPRFDYNPSTLAATGLLVEGTRTNLLTYSEQFDNAAWTKTNSTITANATTSPDGTTTADKIVEDTTAGVHGPQETFTSSAAYYTASVYLKASERSIGCVRLFDAGAGTGYATFFNLSTGAVGTNAAGSTATIQSVGNGWYRCTVSRLFVGAGGSLVQIFSCATDGTFSFAGTNGSGLFAWGAQVELAAFASSYVPTVASTVARAAEAFTISGYANRLVEAYWIDQQTGVSSSFPETVVTSGDTTINPPTFGWVTSLRAYTNAYAGDITTPSWIDNSGTTGNRMYYDSTGTLTWAPANMFLQSNTFNTSWTASGVTLTSGQADPFGGTAAWRLQGTTSVWALSQSMALVGDYIVSFWVKSNTGASQTFRLFGASSVLTSDLTATTDWQRFSFVFSQSATQSIGISRNVANATADLLIYGAQLERVTYQTQPRAYIATTTAAVYQPRYDYDPSTTPATARGMLIEESRANVCVSVNSWTGGLANITRTTNAAISPDGAQNATKIEASVVTTTSFTQAITTTGTGAHTYTIYAKAGTANNIGNRFLFRNTTTATNLVGIILNYGDGTFTYSAGSTGATTTYVGNGWWRISLTSSAITSGDLITVYAGFASAVTVTIGDHFLAFGAQLEAGAFATSYIPTTTASVTRVADVVRWTSAAFSSYWTGSARTIIAEADTSASSGTTVFLANASDGTTNNRLSIARASTNKFAATNVVSGSAAGSATSVGTVTTSSPFRVGTAVSASDIGISLNGENAVVSAVTASPVVSQFNLGYAVGFSTLHLNGHYRSFAYYNQRLPDAILKQKSAVNAPY